MVAVSGDRVICLRIETSITLSILLYRNSADNTRSFGSKDSRYDEKLTLMEKKYVCVAYF